MNRDRLEKYLLRCFGKFLVGLFACYVLFVMFFNSIKESNLIYVEGKQIGHQYLIIGKEVFTTDQITFHKLKENHSYVVSVRGFSYSPLGIYRKIEFIDEN